ncbi:Uncharacterised protein [Burkholderia pseudomallei]|nr:Uncharacterised protein [Burkholderia pseudomallei]
MKCDARRRARAARCVRPRAACRLPSLAPALRHGSTSIGSRWECTPKPRTRRRSQARALRRPDESRPVRLDDRVVARLSRAVDCVRCAAVRACVVVVVARADARPARASARHRVRMRPFAPRPFAPYALPAHGAPMHAFGARADRKRRASARRALTKPRRASARGPNRTRVRSPRYASSRLLTRGRIPFFHVLPTPPPAHRRPSRSFACIGRRALAAFVGCFVGCFADNSWLRSTAAHEAWRACVAPGRGAAACRPDCTSSCSRTAPPFWLTSEYWRPLYCSRSLERRSHRTYF